MEPVLRSLTLVNYRSVIAERIEFDNPTFFVGPNASGKSNIVDAIAFLAETMAQPLSSVLSKRGGFHTVKNRVSGQSEYGLCIRAELAGRHPGQSAHYAFDIQASQTNGFLVRREQFVVRTSDRIVWFDRRADGIIKSNLPGLDPLPTSSKDLAIVLVARAQPITEYIEVLRSALVCANLHGSLRIPQQKDDGLSLQSDASNSVSVIRRILATERGREAMAAKLGAFLPGFKSINHKLDTNEIRLEFEQEMKGMRVMFEPRSMSEGTLRVLLLLTAVMQEKKAQLLVIEEPEASIHPSAAMGILQDILRSYSKERQIIVTTHNTDLLDAQWIEPNHIRMVSWDDGETRVTPVSKPTEKVLRQRLDYPGSALRANILVPSEPPQRPPDAGTIFDDPSGFPAWPRSDLPTSAPNDNTSDR